MCGVLGMAGWLVMMTLIVLGFTKLYTAIG